jgi:hypothetical protein
LQTLVNVGDRVGLDVVGVLDGEADGLVVGARVGATVVGALDGSVVGDLVVGDLDGADDTGEKVGTVGDRVGAGMHAHSAL